MRYLVTIGVTNRFPARFPWGTVVVNVTGCFVIGLLMTLLTQRWETHPNWRLGLVVGFLGGYTTFSSFEWETYAAARGGSPWSGWNNFLRENDSRNPTCSLERSKKAVGDTSESLEMNLP